MSSWQVRVLIKAARFLRTRTELYVQNKTVERQQTYEKMRSVYLACLLDHLRGICLWILNIVPFVSAWKLQQPHVGILACDIIAAPKSKRKCKLTLEEWEELAASDESRKFERRRQDSRVKSQQWFCALIVWYMWTQYREIFENKGLRRMVKDRLGSLETIGNGDNEVGTTDAFDNPHICFLRWYHSHSVYKIAQMLQTEADDHKSWAQQWQARAERALRSFGQGRLIHQNLSHDVANLALVGNEIEIEYLRLGPQRKTCFEYTQGLIKRRQETKLLNPGRSIVRRWDPIRNHAIRSSVPRPAPWESICLGHHVPVNLGIAVSVEGCMEACKEFLLADYTFAADFDASNPKTVAQWWDMTTSSIISWKILDGVMSEDSAERQATFSQPAKSEHPKSKRHLAESSSATEDSIQTFVQCILKRLPPTEDLEGYSWIKRRPGSPYHDDAAVQSLEDTPQVYEQKQTNITIRTHLEKYFKDNAMHICFEAVEDYFLRRGVQISFGEMRRFFKDTAFSVYPGALEKFFAHNCIAIDPEVLEKFFQDTGMSVHRLWTLENMKHIIPPEKLRHLSCFDFTLKADGGDAPEIGVTPAKGRASLVKEKPWAKVGGVTEDEMDEMNKRGDSGLLTLYILGKHGSYPDYEKFPEPFKLFLDNSYTRNEWLKSYQDAVLAVLNDSVSNPTWLSTSLLTHSLSWWT